MIRFLMWYLVAFMFGFGVLGQVNYDNKGCPLTSVKSCPENMTKYTIIGCNFPDCDCEPGYLYYSLTESCYPAYRQGPCPAQQYLVLPEGKTSSECVINSCSQDGRVPFNNACYNYGETCALDSTLAVNSTTFALECQQIIPSMTRFIIDVPRRKRSECPRGSRADRVGRCRQLA